MIYAIFKKIPPVISVKVFYAYIIFSVCFRFLFKTAYGLLIVSVLIYLNSENIVGNKALGFEELLVTVASLDSSYKVALMSSFVTIAGFAIAFHTATINWRNQMRSQIMLNVSAETEEFFARVSRGITTIKIHAESLVESVNKIQAGLPMADSAFLVDVNHDQQDRYLAARDVLSEAAIEVHRLIGRNNNALASNWGALSAVQRAADALSKLSRKMWIHLPVIDPADPNRVQSFINQVNVMECRELIDVCDKTSGVINGLSGGVRGQLQSSVLGFNAPMFFGLILNRKQFREAIENFHKDLNE